MNVHLLYDKQPIKISEKIVQKLVNSSEKLNLSHRKMLSNAVYNAMMMVKAFPTGLIFVPSINGISHNKDEYTSIEQIRAGVTLLKEAMLEAAIVTEVSYFVTNR